MADESVSNKKPKLQHQQPHTVVVVSSSHDDWVKARRDLLISEKELTKQTAIVAKKRSELPWERVSIDYEFTLAAEEHMTDDEEGTKKKVKLSELFVDAADNGGGKKKTKPLIVQHFMFTGGDNGCSLCSFFLDGVNGIYEHLNTRVTFVAIAIGPSDELYKVKVKKGWKFPVLSSSGTTFNRDYGVSWTEDELKKGTGVYNYDNTWTYGTEAPGISVFTKGDEDGIVYHTYSTYAAGLSSFNSMFSFLDIIPEGRDEVGKRNMWWVKHKEDYT